MQIAVPFFLPAATAPLRVCRQSRRCDSYRLSAAGMASGSLPDAAEPVVAAVLTNFEKGMRGKRRAVPQEQGDYESGCKPLPGNFRQLRSKPVFANAAIRAAKSEWEFEPFGNGSSKSPNAQNLNAFAFSGKKAARVGRFLLSPMGQPNQFMMQAPDNWCTT